MTRLTLDAILDNPWNAVDLPLPSDPDQLLLVVAFRAAFYCRTCAFQLMEAARHGDYIPAGWEPGPEGCDVHEEVETRWFNADRRVDRIADSYERIFGEPIYDVVDA